MATWTILCCLCAAFVLVKCAPAGGHTAPDDDEANADGDIMPYDASDIDSAQLRGRYDARLLSENISGYQAEAQTSADDEEATSCRNANAKYVHGQKVPRNDPCEVCLCVDGEIFCWWKKCDHLLKKFAQLIKHRRKSAAAHRKRKKTAAAASSRHRDWLKRSHDDGARTGDDDVDDIPLSVRNFPQHLPAAHFHGVDDDADSDVDGDTAKEDVADDDDDDDDNDNDSDSADADAAAIDRRPEIEANIESAAPLSTSSSFSPQPARPGVNRQPPAAFGNSATDRTTDSKNAVVAKSPGLSSDAGGGAGAMNAPNGVQPVRSDNGDTADASGYRNDGDNAAGPLRTTARSVVPSWRVITTGPAVIMADEIVQPANRLVPSKHTARPSNTTTNDDAPPQYSSSAASAAATVNIDGTAMPIERGYYEKTIFNKNGVFIENIRKIGNLGESAGAAQRGPVSGCGVDGDDDVDVHHKVILNAQTSSTRVAGGGGGGGRGRGPVALMRDDGGRGVDENVDDDDEADVDADDDDEAAIAAAAAVAAASAASVAAAAAEARERQKIALMSVPLSEHYVITSSGRIAKTADALASDDVITQFREGLAGGGDYQQQQQAAMMADDAAAAAAAASQLSSGAHAMKQMPPAAELSSPTKGPAATTTNDGDDGSQQQPPMCIVMAKSYAVGAVLPQEPGNCLQCVCTAGTPDDVSPRVTCSSHNCPPLILPDLFDATGY